MQSQSLSTQGLKELLQKVISQKGQSLCPQEPDDGFTVTAVSAHTPLHTPQIKEDNPVFASVTAAIPTEIEEEQALEISTREVPAILEESISSITVIQEIDSFTGSIVEPAADFEGHEIQKLPIEQASTYEEVSTQKSIISDSIENKDPLQGSTINPGQEQVDLIKPEVSPSLMGTPNEKPRQAAKYEAKIEEKEKQILTLKKNVKELNFAVQSQEKIKTALEKSNNVLEKQLEKSQVLLDETSKRAKELELLSTTLTSSLEEQKVRSEQQASSLKETISSLTHSLEKARLEAQGTEDTLCLKIQASSQDTQETKLRLLRLISDKKELEDKVTSLSCEKATLAARMQSLTQKNVKLEESEAFFTGQLKEVTAALETITAELASVQEQLHDECTQTKMHQAKIEEYTQTISELSEKLDLQATHVQQLESKNAALTEQLESISTAHSQELAVTKACLSEQSHVLEEEQKKLRLLSQEHLFAQKRTEEQENHLRLLEQHLARRVKECALLSKQLEDLMDRTSQLQTTVSESHHRCSILEESLQASKKIENALRIELDSQANHLQDQLQTKDGELKKINEQLLQKENELVSLRRIQQQFSQLENLVKRSAEIFNYPDTAGHPSSVQLSQQHWKPSQTLSQPIPLHDVVLPQLKNEGEVYKIAEVQKEAGSQAEPQIDIFSFPIASKPQPKSLFE